MVKNLSGSSLVEVMIMMVIMSISVVGIYTMVNNGQKLAQSSENRRVALSIAREGLEGVTNLRDTFTLRKYTSNTGCFFSIDATNYGPCPDETDTYSLLLRPSKLIVSTEFSVCIDSNGWYTQDPAICTPSQILCPSVDAKSCQTRFDRSIRVNACDNGLPLDQCLTVTADVRWGIGDDKQVSLTQILTKH